MAQQITGIKIKCPGCTMSTQLGSKDKGGSALCRMPALFRPSILTFKCAGCESLLVARLEMPQKKDGAKDGEIRTRVKIQTESQFLRAMREEERRFQEEPHTDVQP